MVKGDVHAARGKVDVTGVHVNLGGGYQLPEMKRQKKDTSQVNDDSQKKKQKKILHKEHK